MEKKECSVRKVTKITKKNFQPFDKTINWHSHIGWQIKILKKN